MSEKITELNGGVFDKEISKGNWIVDFWAAWCGPCKMLAPEFEDAANELGEGIKFGKVNVDEQQDIAGQYGIMSLPTIMFFKDGQPVEQSVGLVDKDKIVELAKGVF